MSYQDLLRITDEFLLVLRAYPKISWRDRLNIERAVIESIRNGIEAEEKALAWRESRSNGTETE